MSRTPRLAPLLRCSLVWLVVTGGALVTTDQLSPRLPRGRSFDLARLDATPFEALLAHGCAVALLACALWLWLVTTLLLLEALTGLPLWRAGCPPGLRRALLSACGVALVAGATSVAPAGADTSAAGLPPASTGAGTNPALLEGLRIPDRTTARTPARAAAAQGPVPSTRATVRVDTGDTLWDLARARLPASASDAEVTRAWRDIWRDNHELIGPDPDLIHPGTVLQLTDPKELR